MDELSDLFTRSFHGFCSFVTIVMIDTAGVPEAGGHGFEDAIGDAAIDRGRRLIIKVNGLVFLLHCYTPIPG